MSTGHPSNFGFVTCLWCSIWRPEAATVPVPGVPGDHQCSDVEWCGRQVRLQSHGLGVAGELILEGRKLLPPPIAKVISAFGFNAEQKQLLLKEIAALGFDVGSETP